MIRFKNKETLKSYATRVQAFDGSPQSLWSFIEKAVAEIYYDAGYDPEELKFDADITCNLLAGVDLRDSKATGFLGMWLGHKLTIKVSTHLTPEGYKDTLMHEIAHAVVMFMGRCDDHGPNWKAAARNLGADPKATATDEAFMAHRNSKRKPVAECRKCGYILHRERRKCYDGYIHKYDEAGNKCGGTLRNLDGWEPEWVASHREYLDANR